MILFSIIVHRFEMRCPILRPAAGVLCRPIILYVFRSGGAWPSIYFLNESSDGTHTPIYVHTYLYSKMVWVVW